MTRKRNPFLGSRKELLEALLIEMAEEMGAVGIECKFIMKDPDGEITWVMGDVHSEPLGIPMGSA